MDLEEIIQNSDKVFETLLTKRPEINLDSLKKDLEIYYFPYIKKLIDRKNKKSPNSGLVVGVSAIQGTGKTTQGEILKIILDKLNFHSVSLSIDDHYITHSELSTLRQQDPHFIRRGVTHDINLAIKNLTDLKNMQDQKPVFISGYDKGAHHGDGDRFSWINIEDNSSYIEAVILMQELYVNQSFQKLPTLVIKSLNFKNSILPLPKNFGSPIPLLNGFLSQELIDFLKNYQNQTLTIYSQNQEENKIIFKKTNGQIFTSLKKDLPNGWKIIDKKPDFIFYDGWMLGARSVSDESVFMQNLPALETEDAKQFAKKINKKLIEYEPLWQKLEFLNVLYVPNYLISITWRDQAEQVLRAKGEGMSNDQIKQFVYYFWRSVHPAIHIKNLAINENYTDQVVIINDDHSIKEVLTPTEVRVKYPK